MKEIQIYAVLKNQHSFLKQTITLFVFLFVFAVKFHAQALHPVKDNIACLWGLKNDSAKWVIQPKYTALESNYPGLFLVFYSDRWGLLDIEGKELLQPIYEKLRPLMPGSVDGQMSGYTEVAATKNGKTGILDLNGNILIPFIYDAVWKEYYETYYHTYLNKKSGLRTKEKELLPCIFHYLKKIDGTGLFVAGGEDPKDNTGFGGKNFGVIDMNGDTIIPCRFEWINVPSFYIDRKHDYSGYQGPPKRYLVNVRSTEGMGLYTIEGRCVLEPKYTYGSIPMLDYYGRFSSSFYHSNDNFYYEGQILPFIENGKTGLISAGKGVVQPAEFDSIFLESPYDKRPSFYRARKNGKWGLLNTDGKTVLAHEYEQIQFHLNLIFVFGKKSRIQEYDYHHNTIKPKIYQRIITKEYAHIDVQSGNDWYSNYNNTELHLCKVLGELPDDIKVINPGDAIKGKGKKAERITLDYLPLNNKAFYSVETKKGKLLCNDKYEIVLKPGTYSAFKQMEDSPNIVVITKSGMVGMIDTTSKLVLDTIYEAVGWKQINGLMFVKPYKPKDSLVTGHCEGGWALTDSTGKFLTEAIFLSPGLSEYQDREFVMTKDGVGVFDNHLHKFVTRTNHINGFFTGNGGCIMQTQDSLFMPYSFEGKQLSEHAWKGLLHLAGDVDVGRYSAYYNIINNQVSRDSSHWDDSWLFTMGDSLAIMSGDYFIRDRSSVLSELYSAFANANAWDPEGSPSYYDWYGHKAADGDCPRLDPGEGHGYYPWYNIVVINTDSSKIALPVVTKTLSINDSLAIRIARHAIKNAKYPLEPSNDIGCGCIAANYEKGVVFPPSDFRTIHEYPVSVYYRVVHRNENLISLQILDEYHRSNYTASNSKEYSSRSIFENYAIKEGQWRALELKDLFKPGFEKLLQSELVLSIQKADSLEMDCHNPGTFLDQCSGRFSMGEKGLWLYLEDNSYYEFAPLMIPWNRIKSIVSPTSPVFSLLQEPKKQSKTK